MKNDLPPACIFQISPTINSESTWPGLKLLIHPRTSWPYLISELLVAGSSWPCTFFTPQVFLFSYIYIYIIIIVYIYTPIYTP